MIAIVRRWGLFALIAGVLTSCGSPKGADGDGKVTVIRIGAPVVSGSQQVYYGAMGIARAKGFLDREFAKDGIRIDYAGFSNAAMVAQALANDQVDFAAQGDMISIISHAGGTDTRLILPSGRYSNAFLAVPTGSTIRTVEQLRGKRVAYTKGNYIQMQALRILDQHGLKESDIRAINLSPAAASAALAAGQVDAVFQNAEILTLRDKGLARIIFDTKQSPLLTAQTGILVRQAFAKAHPDLVNRVVKVMVEASRYGSDEPHREELIGYWSTGGRTPGTIREDYAGRPLRESLSPLLDPFFQSRYEQTQRDTEKLGLLKAKPFDIGQWFDRSYLDRALRDLKLEGYWTPLGPDGKPLPAGAGS